MSHGALLISVLFLLAPWMLAGLGDWLCHRHSLIERTSGPSESALHLLLYLVIAVPIVLVLFLDVNAMLLLFMTACVLAHAAASSWDTGFAQSRRHISPLEQQLHSYQDMLPLLALALVLALNWNALLQPAWNWSLRLNPLPAAWTCGVLLSLAAGLLLVLEELWRCLRSNERQDRQPSSQSSRRSEDATRI
jgi:hypothetical protein